jgi:N-methylhydantoinase B/oxoprolinase/acetone carboxylase alpha subunit
MKIKTAKSGRRYWTPLDDVFDVDSTSAPKSFVEASLPKEKEPDLPTIDFSSVRAKIRAMIAAPGSHTKELKELVEIYGREKVVELFRDEKKKP